MNLSNKTILVTGGAGFIGTYLCKKLADMHANVIAVDRLSEYKRNPFDDNITLVKSDVRSISDYKEYIDESDVVFHLAALDNRQFCLTEANETLSVNTQGTSNLISHCKDIERFIFTSSIMVYGESLYLPVDELHPLNGYEPYAVSKICSEHIIKMHNYLNKIPYTITRLSFVYGPGKSDTSLIPSMILQGYKEKKIDVWCSDTIRDYLYVEDCVDGLIKLAESDEAVNKTVNLGTGIQSSTLQLAQILSKILGVEYYELHKKKPIGHQLVFNINKLKELISWDPDTSLEEGLSNVVDYYKDMKYDYS